MKRTNLAMYNAIAILFAALTIFVFLCTLLMFSKAVPPPAFLSARSLGTPTVYLAATDTITPTPSNTPIPTRTPIPPTSTPIPPTETPLPSATPIPPSSTPIPPTPLPSASPIPSPTLPPTAIPPTLPPTKPPTATKRVTPSRTPRGFVPSKTPEPGVPTSPPLPSATVFPTVKPQSNQPFILQDGYPTAGPNPDFTRGCNYLGLAGVVFDLNKQTLRSNRYKVNITTPDKKTIQVFSNPQNDKLYTSGSWVAQLDDKLSKGTFVVQLVNSANKSLSDKISVNFEGDCEQNVIYLNFVQVKTADLP